MLFLFQEYLDGIQNKPEDAILISDDSDNGSSSPPTPPPKSVLFARKQNVRTYLLEKDEVECKVSKEKLKTLKKSDDDEYEMRPTVKKVKNFKEYFQKRVSESQKLLSKPVVNTLSDEQKQKVTKGLKKLIDMRARVKKLSTGNPEPLSKDEEFFLHEDDN